MDKLTDFKPSESLTGCVPKLNQSETYYKEIFRLHPSANLDKANTLKEIAINCPELASHAQFMRYYRPQNSLDETVLPSESDTEIFRHDRYSPAFLHSHTFFEMVYVLHGTCENIFSSHTVTMKTGDICIIAPSVTHAISAFSNDCIVFNFVMKSATFKSVFLNSLPNYSALYDFFRKSLYAPNSSLYLYFKTGKDPVLLDIFDKIVDEHEAKKSYFSSMTNALLTTFFITLLRNHEESMTAVNPSEKKQDSNIVFILKYIETHYNTLTLQELADFFNYSEKQLSRILKNYTGQTFSALVQNMRLSRAAELLKQPTLPISEIMETIGYSNTTHFYKIFKSKFGMTPAEYREKTVKDF